jgi:DNA modification methylase
VTVRILVGDCRSVLRSLPEASVHCCVTSPPYFGLRDYGVAGQIGLEPTPDAFVAEMVAVFSEVRRVLRDDGTLWLNLGDSYNAYNGNRGQSTSFQKATDHALPRLPSGAGLTVPSLKPKDLIGIPWRVAFALQADGWWLRSAIVWAKPNPMPESITDRPTSAYEMVFLLAKSAKYFYDAEAAKEDAVAADLGCYDGGAQKNRDGTNANKGRNYRGGKQAAMAAASNPGTARRMGGFNELWDKAEAEGATSLKRNARNVWTIATKPFAEAHFATFPPELAERCIKAACPAGGTVLDPFGGAGTTGLVADRLQRDAILIELNPEYAAMAERRISGEAGLFADVNAEA